MKSTNFNVLKASVIFVSGWILLSITSIKEYMGPIKASENHNVYKILANSKII